MRNAFLVASIIILIACQSGGASPSATALAPVGVAPPNPTAEPYLTQAVTPQSIPGMSYLYAGAQLSSLPEQVSFTYQGLTAEVAAEIQLARPYIGGPSGPSPDLAYPTHLRFYFYLEPSDPLFGRERPHLRIYPANDYRLSYGPDSLHQADTPGYIINATIDRLQAILVDRPQTIEGDIPFLPPQHISQYLKAQVKYLDFQNGAGIRFITQYTEGSPINNQDLFYTFQGLTADGEYYLALFYPVSTPALAEVNEAQSFESLTEFQTDVQDMTLQLDALSPGDFAPDLSLLDELNRSLQITSTP
jgi:hypothetical protein